MIERLPLWLRRALALTLLAVVVLAAYEALVAPALADYRQSREAVATAHELIARYQRLGARRGALETELAQLRRHDLARLGVLEGDNETLVSAELQNRIKSIAEAEGGELKSLQVLPARDEERFRRLTVRAQLAVSEEALRRILHAVEASQPFLFVDQAEVRSRPVRARQGRAESGSVLEARFDIFGFMRGKPQ